MTEDHPAAGSVSIPQHSSQADLVAPAPPDVVWQRFADAAPLLVRYAQWLADAGTVRGLLGPREVPRIWDRHLLNCLALTDLIPVGERLVDVGSGAGLPGLVIACARPDVRVDLVESMSRRTDFLSEVVADLGLPERVRVIKGRAEDVAVVKTVGSSKLVTARAVAPLDKLIRWSLPLLARGGSLLALKGSTAEDEIAEHKVFLQRSRVQIYPVIECGVGLVDPPTRVIKLTRR